MSRETAGAGHVLLTPNFASLAPEAETEQLADLLRLSDPGLSELRLEALLDEVLTRIRDVLHVDTVAVLLHDPLTDELVARAAKGLEAEVEQGVRIPFGKGFAGRIAAERCPIFIPHVEDADILNPILRDMGISSMLGVPLIVEAQLIGVLHVGSLTPRTFTSADAALLDLAAGRVAPGIERARLSDELTRERLAAETLQRGLLPVVRSDLPDVDVAIRYVPARDEIGGDWYDVIPLPQGQVGVVIGDVVGHGVRAAALMSQVRAALRAYALTDVRPASVLTRLDRYVQHGHPNGMATVVYALLDPVSGRLTFSSAGHPPPVLTGPSGARLLESDIAPPIGVRPFPVYADTVIDLEPGETFLLYTDGLVERRGEPLGKGLERLRSAAVGDARPEVLLARVQQAMVGPRAAEDDVALVALARAAAPTGLHLQLAAERDALAPLRHQLRSWLRARGADDAETSAIVLAVGEAAANAIEHAYPPTPAQFEVRAVVEDGTVIVSVSDEGRWREHEGSTHRGRGLKIMRATMDTVDVHSDEGGTRVVLRRRLAEDGR